MTEQDKVTVDDIIGIIKTEEQTNSVEEVRKLRGRENKTAKRFTLRLSKLGNGMITDTQKREDLYFDKEYLDATLPKANEWLNELAEENEKLKSTIKDVVELLSEEVDVFSDKALEHDICAYIELKKLDNKDAYYMAISTKKAIQMLKGDVE